MVKLEGFKTQHVDDLDYFYEEEETTPTQTMLNLLKMNIGIGFLTLPYAVKEGNLIVGSILIVLIGVVINYNMLIMSETNLILVKKFKLDRLGFAGTVKYSLMPYMRTISLNILTVCIKGFLALYLIGSSALYIVSASEIISEVSGNLFSDTRVWTILIALPVMAMTFISNTSTIFAISNVSNALILFSLLCVIAYVVPNIRYLGVPSKMASWQGIANCISTVVFAYEGVCSMLPVINVITDKSKIPQVVNTSNAICVIIYFLIGTFGYLAFGPETKAQVLINIPGNSFYGFVKIAYSFGIILSFIMTIYCALTMIVPPILKTQAFFGLERIVIQFYARFILIIAGVSLAVGFPWLEDMLNILGSFFALPISFVIPPILHTLILLDVNNGGRRKYLLITLNLCLIFIGTFFTIIGMVSSIQSLLPKL